MQHADRLHKNSLPAKKVWERKSEGKAVEKILKNKRMQAATCQSSRGERVLSGGAYAECG